MNKMTLDSVSVSSDDDIPLNVIGAGSHTAGPSLRIHSLENCEFCEHVSYNKYNALVHNAKHIIIPLLKQEVHQCTLCLFYFTSRYKLKHHLRNKHRNDNNNKQTQQTNEKATIKNGNEKECVHKKSNGNEIVTKYETDDEDDLPLKVTKKLKVNTVTKETENHSDDGESDALIEAREKLMKDVKVVLEKLETRITDNHSITIVPEEKSRISNQVKLVPHIEPNVRKHSNNIKVSNIVEPDATSSIHTEVPQNVEPAMTSNHSVQFASDIETKASNHNAMPDRPKVKIRSRLTFEDDIDDICNDEVIKDLTRDCLVDMNLFDEPWLDDLANSITDDDLINLEDDIILIDDDDDESQHERAQSPRCSATVTDVHNVHEDMDVDYSPSMHHDELIKPGVFRCKRCPETFPTKFNQFQHEMQHVRISKPRPLLCEHCDRFFASKELLKSHLTSKHKSHYHQRPFKTCKKCNLKYSDYERHLEIYHIVLRCHLCNQGFDNEMDRLNHIRGHLIKTKCSQCDFIAFSLEIIEHEKLFHKVSVSTTKTFNLCDVCCLFLRNKNNMQYVFGETVSKIGERMYCEHCAKPFFQLTRVTRFGKGRPKEDIVYERHKKKARSNTERLKNIQQRLKMINKLSRF